jgi:hypothetical protein
VHGKQQWCCWPHAGGAAAQGVFEGDQPGSVAEDSVEADPHLKQRRWGGGGGLSTFAP